MTIPKAIYADLMREGREAQARGDMEIANHLFDLAVKVGAEDGRLPIGAIISRALGKPDDKLRRRSAPNMH